jgi:hypothetical protein
MGGLMTDLHHGIGALELAAPSMIQDADIERTVMTASPTHTRGPCCTYNPYAGEPLDDGAFEAAAMAGPSTRMVMGTICRGIDDGGPERAASQRVLAQPSVQVCVTPRCPR